MLSSSSTTPSSTFASSIITRAAAAAATLVLAVLPTAHRHPVPAVCAFNVASSSMSSSMSSSSRMMRRRIVGIGEAMSGRTSTSMSSSSSSTSSVTTNDVVSLSLEKPLGLILEEADIDDANAGGEGGGGVIVSGLNEGGSAYLLSSSIRDSLLGSRVMSVMGVDVSSFTFEDVMDAVVGADSPVDISFRVMPKSSSSSSSSNDDTTATPVVDAPPTAYGAGAIVDIIVQQPHSSSSRSDIAIKARVGDNLRKTLLSDPNVELYRGLKKKLGNCGGGGQCGFCAVELIDNSENGAWGTRSDYETKKIGKNGNESYRLACMNNIVGPATVRTL
ncbi:hypothetical protein ACHAXA_006309 [Cyclostephanos tholiformis]|uniref:2Fe-2S ferredoxin-type domain-containing protein n=1 Tax=Cyclostephanos tholiformis TaxID=382380 RepID=A0ABD3RFH0_9STRA